MAATKKPKPVCETVFPWLRANLGKGALAALTGTDARALRAAVQIIELYAYDRRPGVIRAFGLVASQMQWSTQYLAYHAIAHVMEWDDRYVIWGQAYQLLQPTGGGPVYLNPRMDEAPECVHAPGNR